MSWLDSLGDVFSDKDVLRGLFSAGASLAGNLFTSSQNDQTRQDELAFQQQKLAQDKELALAQIAASGAGSGVAAATAKEIAKKQIAAKMAGDYGSLVSRSSLARAESLKDKDVEIPQSISSMFGRVQQSLGR